MTDETQPDSRTPRPADQALAESRPDDSHILLRMVTMLLKLDGPLRGTIGIIGANTIMLLWVFAKFAVPAILALAAVMNGDNSEVLNQISEKLDHPRALECHETPLPESP